MFEKSKEVKKDFENIKDVLKRLTKLENVIIYIVAIAVSMVPFLGEMNPFGMAYLAAVYLSGIPIFGIIICSGIRNIIWIWKKLFISIYIVCNSLYWNGCSI